MPWLDLVRSEAQLVSRFTVIGVLATLVHLLVSFALFELTGLSVQHANFGGFIVALCVSYTGHYHFSFKSSKTHTKTLPRFFATTCIAYAGNVLVIVLSTSLTALPENICLLLGVGIMPLISFTLSRIWVY